MHYDYPRHTKCHTDSVGHFPSLLHGARSEAMDALKGIDAARAREAESVSDALSKAAPPAPGNRFQQRGRVFTVRRVFSSIHRAFGSSRRREGYFRKRERSWGKKVCGATEKSTLRKGMRG